MIKTVGSICSGIEACSVAWSPLGFKVEWLSETASFPSKLLAVKYPNIPNLGDMNTIPEMLARGEIFAPDMLCGGTPCQAFSFAGRQKGLEDKRGNLSLKFIDIVNANDKERARKSQPRSVVFWENVEGVLTDKTNAFGCLVSSLAGFDKPLCVSKWPSAGFISGRIRNIAWRVLDAKYFGVPQQRRRLYLLAGGKEFHPESVLFEQNNQRITEAKQESLTFNKDGSDYEVFRAYTDCLYASYGTKWNGNAAANNGSLFIVQDGRIRRLSPLECERLMGFPDNYTNIPKATKTNRYQAIGNSWAVPVIYWIGKRLAEYKGDDLYLERSRDFMSVAYGNGDYFDFGQGHISNIVTGNMLNCTDRPEKYVLANMRDIVDSEAPEDIYISPVGCYGIVRRKNERGIKINSRLEQVLLDISSKMSAEDIEKRSRIQKRGRFAEPVLWS